MAKHVQIANIVLLNVLLEKIRQSECLEPSYYLSAGGKKAIEVLSKNSAACVVLISVETVYLATWVLFVLLFQWVNV